MDAISNAMNVLCVGRIPQRSRVSEMGLGCKEEFEGDVGGSGRVIDESVWLVLLWFYRAQIAQ